MFNAMREKNVDKILETINNVKCARPPYKHIDITLSYVLEDPKFNRILEHLILVLNFLLTR